MDRPFGERRRGVTEPVILVVDDEERILFVLQNALMRGGDGFEVMAASTAEDGLRKLRDRRCDLVLTDLVMPGTGGIAFTERLRQLDQDVTVVWMTAYGCHSFRKEIERLRVYRCVEKPLEIAEIREVARDALAAREPA